MPELHSLYLQSLWEEMTYVNFLSLTQGMKYFWGFAVDVQMTSALLKGMLSYKYPKAACKWIEGGMV